MGVVFVGPMSTTKRSDDPKSGSQGWAKRVVVDDGRSCRSLVNVSVEAGDCAHNGETFK
jgi:hypothetical protein